MSAVELKALHDSFVELYIQQTYGCSLYFFHSVFAPACQKMASCGRGRGKLAGRTDCNALFELVSPQHDISNSSIAALTKH